MSIHEHSSMVIKPVHVFVNCSSLTELNNVVHDLVHEVHMESLIKETIWTLLVL